MASAFGIVERVAREKTKGWRPRGADHAIGCARCSDDLLDTPSAKYSCSGDANVNRHRRCRASSGRLLLRDRKFADSALEGDGFEISVPVAREPVYIAEGELRGDRRAAKKI